MNSPTEAMMSGLEMLGEIHTPEIIQYCPLMTPNSGNSGNAYMSSRNQSFGVM